MCLPALLSASSWTLFNSYRWKSAIKSFRLIAKRGLTLCRGEGWAGLMEMCLRHICCRRAICTEGTALCPASCVGIIEHPELKGPHRDRWVQLPALRGTTQNLRAVSKRPLSSGTAAVPTALWGRALCWYPAWTSPCSVWVFWLTAQLFLIANFR